VPEAERQGRAERPAVRATVDLQAAAGTPGRAADPVERPARTAVPGKRAVAAQRDTRAAVRQVARPGPPERAAPRAVRPEPAGTLAPVAERPALVAERQELAAQGGAHRLGPASNAREARPVTPHARKATRRCAHAAPRERLPVKLLLVAEVAVRVGKRRGGRRRRNGRLDDRFSATFGTSGNMMSLNTTCPSVQSATSLYTGTATQLQIINSDDANEMKTYTNQPQ